MSTAAFLRVLIVDDEEPARTLLKEYLAQLPQVEVAGECANGFEAVKAVAEHRPDVLLLDIQMPKLSGFEVLELLPDPPAVVFITAHDEFAVRAFEAHAVDYLLKPVTPTRLAQALARARARLGAQASLDAAALHRAARPASPYRDRVLVRDGNAVHVLPAAAIDYIEADDDTVILHAGAERHRKQQTLTALEQQLDPRRFTRIHRTFILNLERLLRLERYAKDSYVAILRNGTRLPVSRAGYARLRTLLG